MPGAGEIISIKNEEQSSGVTLTTTDKLLKFKYKKLGLIATILTPSLQVLIYNGKTLDSSEWMNLENWKNLPVVNGLREKFPAVSIATLSELENPTNWLPDTFEFDFKGDIEKDLSLYPGQEVITGKFLYKVSDKTIIRLKRG